MTRDVPPAAAAPVSAPRSLAAGSLAVHFDDSASATLRLVLTEHASLFVETDARAADVVIFGSDEIDYIDKSALYRAYKSKSICITESDIPTFRLPGLYAANQRSFLTSSRTKSISYFMSERDRGNPEIKRLIGRKPEKRYLYSFMGGSNCWARKRIFRSLRTTADTVVEATDSYNHWTNRPEDIQAKANQMRRYADVMGASKFALCPRGCGLSSYRLFESMSLGIAPVIISDKWRPIEGIDWSFAIFVPERQIPHIDRILRAHEGEWEQRGQAALAAYRSVLDKEVIAMTLHGQIAGVVAAYRPTREAIMAILTRARVVKRESYWVVYGWLKRLVLRGFYISGLPLPIKLHEPLEQQIGKHKPAALRANNS
jgi:hypothetical protein